MKLWHYHRFGFEYLSSSYPCDKLYRSHRIVHGCQTYRLSLDPRMEPEDSRKTEANSHSYSHWQHFHSYNTGTPDPFDYFTFTYLILGIPEATNSTPTPRGLAALPLQISHCRKVDPTPHTSSFNMGYLVSPYPYPNGAGGPIPVSMITWNVKSKQTKNLFTERDSVDRVPRSDEIKRSLALAP
ncbi:hypothetical protein KQX54_008885 [Cotesia glomerata]|uniref:Uncharacterized protein n=1 Tax=Cotesia glomerata TaxID=32391 RepID=A0AAV7IIR6_COTGL|nr:hypothetical protein KQX54_008885 [Cotesia glomerata]